MGWFNHNHMPVEGRTILLTGASEGTGLHAALIFASKGANIIIVSRNPTKLEDAIARIKQAAKWPDTQRFYTIVADVAKPNYAESVVADATAWNDGHPPEIVWCLAGLATPMLWVDDGAMEAARYNRAFAYEPFMTVDVNYFGSAEMSRAIMRAWLRPEEEQPKTATKTSSPKLSKHLIFTGTVLSTFTMAGHGPYAPSKFALRGLADSLVMETRLYPDVPIDVHLVLPNSITTAGYERENETKPAITLQLEAGDVPQAPEVVARVAIEGIEKGYYFVTTSFVGELMRWGAMGNSPRNGWVLDMVMGCLLPFVMGFVVWDMNRRVSAWGRKEKRA
ncbi:hypothetical protein HYFRA_00010098 [Hymenoscyphus fraxineus]|uniref:3-dehydrosphinganine reductase n=1 Tax=Hymenoscyphus fraxineus TaxID=746836 RepID=A0A9N9KTI9_9HELO|nr:hypothetical protein HYFRA_00010098 [Hymenoscyphus fraxineus]